MSQVQPSGVSANFRARSYDLAFVVLLAAFILFKWHDLYLPYFWDELGVYSRAAIQFYHQGPSLLPGSLDPEISRGHPLLFQFLSGWMLTIFGNKPFTAHLFALLVSATLLTAVYTKLKSLYNSSIAFSTALLLIVQPAFLAISGLLLPEVMLALWAWLGITNYYQRNYLRAGLYVSLAILTKESAISLPVVLLSYSALHYLFYRDHRGAFRPATLCATIFPFVVLAVFLLIQKQQNAWYFYPYHVSTVTTNLAEVFFNLKRYLLFLFYQYQRYWLSLLMLTALVVACIKGKINIAAGRNNFLLPGIMMSAAVVIGSCFAFYMARYVMLVFPVLALLSALSIHLLFRKQLVRFLLLGTLALTALQVREGNVFAYEDDLSYRKSVTTMQKAIHFTETQLTEGDTIVGRFPVYHALISPEFGYLTKHLPSRPIDSLYWNHVYYIDTDPGLWEPKPWPDSLFIPIKEFKDGYATARVFELLVHQRQQLYSK